MGSLWAVSRGSYSDYRVLCVCDSKKRAKGVVKAMKASKQSLYGDDPFVEEIVYLDRDPERVTVYGISEELLDSGESDNRRDSERVEWEHDMLYPEYNRPVTWRWVRAPYIEKRGGRLEVNGTDLERVRKVFSDRRAMILSDDAMRARKEARG